MANTAPSEDRIPVIVGVGEIVDRPQEITDGLEPLALLEQALRAAAWILTDRADVMLGYCSSSGPVMQEVPGLANVALPPALTVGPAYGLIVLSNHPLAARFALFVLSEPGQAILLRNGFDPIGLATR